MAAHDTTGGMESKIVEAAIIAKLGIDVYITKASTLSPSIASFQGIIQLKKNIV